MKTWWIAIGNTLSHEPHESQLRCTTMPHLRHVILQVHLPSAIPHNRLSKTKLSVTTPNPIAGNGTTCLLQRAARFGGFGASRGVGSFRQLQHMEFYRRSLLGRERVHSLSGLPSGLAALASSCVLNVFCFCLSCSAESTTPTVYIPGCFAASCGLSC